MRLSCYLKSRRSWGEPCQKRVQGFTASRLCARRALAEFGILDFPVQVAVNREPLWPQSLVGSITHAEGFSAAVVAQRRMILAIGIDCERADYVTPDVWDLICTPTESIWRASLSLDERIAAAALLFAAKEAFYKCQYPL